MEKSKNERYVVKLAGECQHVVVTPHGDIDCVGGKCMECGKDLHTLQWEYNKLKFQAEKVLDLSLKAKEEKRILVKDNEGMKEILKMYKEQCDYYGDSLAGSWWDVYNEAEPYIKEERCTAQS